MSQESFETYISITAGGEVEHKATVTGEFDPGYAATREEPGEGPSFAVEGVEIEVNGKNLNIIALLTNDQLDELAGEGVAACGGYVVRRPVFTPPSVVQQWHEFQLKAMEKR